ncbi:MULTISPECIES: murein hydrolase activator EnvC family protein [Bacillaceae]|uniref:murein hydrolase activator EnvC family protein n=1 Tax=Bacillaceae TaxID=186817 RepID=UPI0005A61A6B|nr:peptidoglycan DD-metalloendopeptidase family protein [Bacillus rubiinfantis]
MKKSLVTLTFAAALGFGSLIAENPANIAVAASKLEDLKNQKSEIEEKRSTVNSKINSTNIEINKLKEKQTMINKDIERLDLAIGDAEKKMMQKQAEIKETETEIVNLKEEIKGLEKRIEKRNELLKDRARSLQENGTMINYIDVLLGADSFSDFVSRVAAVATIVDADQDILREHQADKELLEKSRVDVENKLISFQTMLSELEQLKQSLNSEKAEKDKLMASLKTQEEQMHVEKLDLEDEAELLSSQESAMQKAIQLEQQRQVKPVSSAGEKGENSVSSPPVTSGNFTRPTSGTITSSFGGRSGGTHYGTDIAKSGTVPIVASADGVVIRSYYSSSYGNVVFISHSINGQIYTTVYAHMNSRSVSTGQVVSKGQQVGYMGNTGQSFGQHLHFELHRGSWNANKTNAINPVGIVPL